MDRALIFAKHFIVDSACGKIALKMIANNKLPVRGFTIVELLIVIVIIGILAAITVVAYNGIQNRAYDTTVQSDLKSLYKKISLYRIQEDKYPRYVNEFTDMGVALSKSSYSRGLYNAVSWYNVLYCWPNAANPEKFSITAQSKSGKVYTAVNGSVKEATYILSGSNQTCSDAGTSMDRGDYRTWFYDADAWQPYVAG